MQFPIRDESRGARRTFRGPGAACLSALVFASVLGSASASETSGDDWTFRAMGTCQGCTFDGRDLSGQPLHAIDLERASLVDMNFRGASLFTANFRDAKIRDVSFDRADLKGAEFTDARLDNVSFDGADLTGATFDGATLSATELDPATLCFTQMPNGDMNNSDCQ